MFELPWKEKFFLVIEGILCNNLTVGAVDFIIL